MNKLIKFAAMFLTSSFIFASVPVFAQDSQQDDFYGKSKMQFLKERRNPVIGELVSLASANFPTMAVIRLTREYKTDNAVIAKDKEITINLSDKTKFIGKKAGGAILSLVKAGDNIIAFGLMNENGMIDAREFIDNSLLSGHTKAVITSIDYATLRITIDANGVVFSGSLNSNARYMKNGKEARITDFSVGEEVFIAGVVNKNTKQGIGFYLGDDKFKFDVTSPMKQSVKHGARGIFRNVKR